MFFRNVGIVYGAAALAALCRLSGARDLCAAPQAGRVYKVGVVQVTDNETLNEGFNFGRRRLAELGYEKGKNLDLIRRIVLGDTKGLWNQLKLLESLNVFIDEMIEEKVDVAVLISGPAFYFGREKLAAAGVPVVFGAVINPQAVGCPGADRCGDLATGVTVYVDPKKIIHLIRQVFPEARKICAAASMDPDVQFRMDEYARGFEEEKDLVFLHESVLSFTGKGFSRVANRLLNECDVFIALPDPIYMVDHYRGAIEFMGRANRLGVPVVSSINIMTMLGAPLAMGVSPYDQGRALAELAVKILEGKKPGELPIERPGKINFYINGQAWKYLKRPLPISLISNTKRVDLYPFVDPAEVFPPE